jgi:hypothetical protein
VLLLWILFVIEKELSTKQDIDVFQSELKMQNKGASALENKIVLITGIVGAIISYMFGLMGVAVTILILFMFADYVTGLVATGINKELIAVLD